MFCEKCGSKMPDGVRFCVNCGAPMAIPNAAPQPQTPAQPQADPQAQAPVQPQANPQAQAPIQPQLAPQSQTPVQPQANPQAQAPYGGQPQFNQQAPYGGQPQFNQQAPYGGQPQFNQQAPYGGQPQYGQQPQMTAAPQKTKHKGGVIALIIVMILCVVGGGGFAAYRYFGDHFNTHEPVVEEPDDPEEPDEPDDPEPEPEPVVTQAKQTIMLYIIGSNLESEEGLATRDLVEISKTDIADDTNIIIQTGGCEDWDNTFCKDGTVQRFSYRNGKFTELDDLGAIPMANMNNLTDFIKFAADEYPADDYILILWDHGGGVPIGYGIDELFPDEMLYDYQIGHAIDKSGVHFDSVIFDACNMCTLEVAMALKNSADYLIGAESYVNGTGLSYTNWINMLAENPVSTGKYREQVVADYMDYCQERDMVASMSSISLSHIDAVYKAYTDYLDDMKSDLERNKFSDIITARDSCGAYMGTDSVDLVTLANKYESNYSTNLINSVVNAVDYTESDFAYGHGITAYFPYDYSDYYDDGRITFTALEYNDTITGFFDEYVSLCFAYVYGAKDAKNYAGDWYVADIIDDYIGSGYTVAQAGEYELEYDHSVYADGIDHYYMFTSDIEVLESQSLLYLENDGSWIYLGCDEYNVFDTAGDLVAQNPEKWTWINDRVVCYIVYDYYNDDDTGEWSQYALIPVKINGEEAYLMAYYDQDNKSGKITGYMYMDDENYYYELEDDDEIQILWYDYDNDEFLEAYDPFPASEAYLDYNDIDFSMDTTYVVYQVTDVYGNIYTSDAFKYENGELVDIVDF